MLKIDIPGNKSFELKHLVLDYNGTIACDGSVKAGVLQQLQQLANDLKIHVITADTHGSVQQECNVDFISVHVIGKHNQDIQKQAFIEKLGAHNCIAVGNGLNDSLMLEKAVLGVALMQEEGCATKTLIASDLIFNSITEMLQALLQPSRMIASLRN